MALLAALLLLADDAELNELCRLARLLLISLTELPDDALACDWLDALVRLAELDDRAELCELNDTIDSLLNDDTPELYELDEIIDSLLAVDRWLDALEALVTDSLLWL